MGLNATLGMAARSLEVFTAGMNVAGQNLANAQTPGYIRDEMLLQPNLSYAKGSIILGTGVAITGIRQQIDQFLEKRIHTATTDFSKTDARNDIYKQLEGVIGELGTSDLSSSLNRFLSSIHDLVNQPESSSLRQLMIHQGEQFATMLADLRVRVDELRQAQTVAVDLLVKEANGLIDQIADLNPQISQLEASGLLQSDASAMRTLRYSALNRLSEIIPIKYQERADGSVDVYSGSDFIILTGQTQHLETISSGDRNVTVQDVQFSITKSPVGVTGGGELAGIIEGRDVILGGFVDDLNTWTSNLIYEFNKIHATGEGLIGYTSVTAQNRVVDPTAVLNSSTAGLNFQPQHGSFQIKVINTLTGATQTTTIQVDLDGIGSDTTLNSLQAAIDALADVSASVTTDGRLKIDASTNYEVRFADDSSGALAALGINTFFTGHDSSDIGVSSLISGDHRYLAAGKGGGPSDGSNLVNLAAVTTNPVAALGGISLDELYENIVTNVAQASSTEQAVRDGLSAFRDSLKHQRDQYSGVSLDEEAIKVLQYQRAFQASARLISVIDELFTTLLNM